MIDGLTMYIDDPLRLHKALVNTEFAKGDKAVEQESLVRLVLQCDDLQTWLEPSHGRGFACNKAGYTAVQSRTVGQEQ